MKTTVTYNCLNVCHRAIWPRYINDEIADVAVSQVRAQMQSLCGALKPVDVPSSKRT